MLHSFSRSHFIKGIEYLDTTIISNISNILRFEILLDINTHLGGIIWKGKIVNMVDEQR